jgi:dimethylargininase
VRFASPVRALVRPVSDSFDRALQRIPAPLDPEKARAQHALYVAALEEAGVAITWLPPAHALPDAVFVEDPAVICGASALVTIPGAASRRDEAASIGEALAGLGLDVRMQGRGRLDGGDVLRIGDRWFVGRTSRTDDAGIAALREACRGEVVPVGVRDGLHLKSGATLAAPDLVVVDPRAVPPEAFTGVEVLVTEEALGANVLALGDRVLVSAAAPLTAAALHRRGLRVVPLDMSEIHAADGALTCLSLRIPAPGNWCA